MIFVRQINSARPNATTTTHCPCPFIREKFANDEVSSTHADEGCVSGIFVCVCVRIV